jgi:hypothetical protein
MSILGEVGASAQRTIITQSFESAVWRHNLLFLKEQEASGGLYTSS